MIEIYKKYVHTRSKEVILTFILLLLACYSDAITGRTIGTIAASPIFFLAPFLLAFEVYSGLKNKHIDFRSFEWLVLILFIYSTLIGILQSALHGFTLAVMPRMASEIYNYIAFWLLFRLFIRLFNNVPRPALLIAFTAFCIFLIGFMTVEYWYLPQGISWIHQYNPNIYYGRIRLLSAESTETGIIAIAVFCITFCLGWQEKSRFAKEVALSFFIIYFVFTESKGFMADAILAFALLIIWRGLWVYKIAVEWLNNRSAWKPLRSLSLVLLLMVYFSAMFISPCIRSGSCVKGLVDYKSQSPSIAYFYHYSPLANQHFAVSSNHVSYTTRITYLIADSFILKAYPFGAGFGFHLLALRQNIPLAMPYVHKLLSDKADFSEVKTNAQSFHGLGNKTQLGQVMTVAGIPGLILALLALYRLLKINKYELLSTYALLFLVIASCTYMSFGNNYIIALLVAFLVQAKTDIEISCDSK
ncbi:MAG: wzy [Gammaproteobacteria bacterium]|nr:wzy [Gammaproteobacteria bacterium]